MENIFKRPKKQEEVLGACLAWLQKEKDLETEYYQLQKIWHESPNTFRVAKLPIENNPECVDVCFLNQKLVEQTQCYIIAETSKEEVLKIYHDLKTIGDTCYERLVPVDVDTFKCLKQIIGLEKIELLQAYRWCDDRERIFRKPILRNYQTARERNRCCPAKMLIMSDTSYKSFMHNMSYKEKADCVTEFKVIDNAVWDKAYPIFLRYGLSYNICQIDYGMLGQYFGNYTHITWYSKVEGQFIIDPECIHMIDETEKPYVGSISDVMASIEVPEKKYLYKLHENYRTNQTKYKVPYLKRFIYKEQLGYVRHYRDFSVKYSSRENEFRCETDREGDITEHMLDYYRLENENKLKHAIKLGILLSSVENPNNLIKEASGNLLEVIRHLEKSLEKESKQPNSLTF